MHYKHSCFIVPVLRMKSHVQVIDPGFPVRGTSKASHTDTDNKGDDGGGGVRWRRQRRYTNKYGSTCGFWRFRIPSLWTMRGHIFVLYLMCTQSIFNIGFYKGQGRWNGTGAPVATICICQYSLKRYGFVFFSLFHCVYFHLCEIGSSDI